MSAPAAQLRGCLVALAAVAAAALLVAGCGGSSSDRATADGAGGTKRADYIVGANDPVTSSEGGNEIVAARFPGGHETDEVSASGAKPIEPCSLVSPAQARRILGGKVHIVERLQGPTCLFTGSGRQVALVVEEVPLKQLVKGARSRRPVRIRRHRGWCIRFEASSVAVRVGRDRVLQVTGACPAGVRFAAAALPRIPR